MTLTEFFMKRVSNIAWHINTNRDVCGDKSTLDEVQRSLNNLLKEYEEMTCKSIR